MKWVRADNGISSEKPLYVPFLNQEIKEFWFEIEVNHNWFTSKQELVYRDLMSLSHNTLKKLDEALKSFLKKQMVLERIKEVDINDRSLSELINWDETLMFIPVHYNSIFSFIFFLPEINIQLKESTFNFELEIVLKGGEVELIQEMTGLWNYQDLWEKEFLKL